ncbi:MAG TPA: hypothetical protein VIJ12_00440 [Candidatus Baltobacteraceae bacterium]
MIVVQTAIRAWVQPAEKRRGKRGAIPWRAAPYGQRVLLFDTETTTDCAQRLLFGFFRLYDNDRLVGEGMIVADVLDYEQMIAVQEYATKHRLPIYSRERFVETVFYPEVYERGTLCVGFNLPFDCARIAVHAGCGRGKNRRKFRIVLSRRLRWHDLRVESASGRAAFIGFVPKRKKLYAWEKPFFTGRFLDVSTLAGVFTGERHTLYRAGKTFRAHTLKMPSGELGTVDRRMLTYGRQDVRATWALCRKLRAEYVRHPFATFANERDKPEHGRYMGQLFSGASLAKAYLRLLDIGSILDRQPDFNPVYLGYGTAAYIGGRAEVQVRKTDVPVKLLDFTSMYPTVFVLQDLQSLVRASMRAVRIPAREVHAFLDGLTLDDLYKSEVWPLFNCLVLIDPNADIVPVRMRLDKSDPYTIAVTPFTSSEVRWYTLADLAASVLLSGKVPHIRRAIRFLPQGDPPVRTVQFRGAVPLTTAEPMFKVIVEQRQRAKRGGGTHDDAGLERGLKLLANSGAYGIYAEVNVTPTGSDLPGTVYSDKTFELIKVHNERPGDFTNPIIASLVTGGARLILAMLETEVRNRGGTFAFCDTDSLAIVCGDNCPKAIPCLQPHDVEAVIAKFDALNPYDPDLVPHLLKVEYPDIPDLRCFAISAKRYVLYRWRKNRRIQIAKASESGLGAIIGRSANETTPKLARRIWLAILMAELRVNAKQRRRAKPLIDFNAPLRRKFPISQPSILKRLDAYNRTRSYDHQVKPSGFVQSVTPAIIGSENPLPIAPFSRELSEARKLPWVDFHTGKPVHLDWDGNHFAGTIPVLRMNEYLEQYRRHPEAKAADANGNPAGEETVGVLGRLEVRSGEPARIGKEIDRLDQDEGATLDGEAPIEYERDQLADDIALLATFPQKSTAREIGISERRWRDILKGNAVPRGATAETIARVAMRHRINSVG